MIKLGSIPTKSHASSTRPVLPQRAAATSPITKRAPVTGSRIACPATLRSQPRSPWTWKAPIVWVVESQSALRTLPSFCSGLKAETALARSRKAAEW